jgi:heme/copper-type cytochrome/quinol oxidase subunit 3
MDIPYTVSARPDTGLYNAKLGIWLFLASEVMLFGGLFSAYIFLRVGADYPWPIHELEVLPGFVNTMVLIASSVTVVMAWASLKLRKFGQFKLYMALTVACAAVFMVLKAYEYNKKFHHYAVTLEDGTVITGHFPDEGYLIRFGEVNQLTLTIPVETSGLAADPLKRVMPFETGDGDVTFTTADGSEVKLDRAGWSQLRANVVAAAREKNREQKARLRERIADKRKEVAAVEESGDAEGVRAARAELLGLERSLGSLNVVPPQTVRLTSSRPLSFAVKRSAIFTYTDASITFRDGTVAKGKLVEDRMTIEVDGVDTRSVVDKEKSLAWEDRYLGEEWRKVFVARKEHALTSFEEKYKGKRDPLKSATLQVDAYFLKIKNDSPAYHAPKGAGGQAAVGLPVLASGSADGHGHHPKLLLEKKDVTFFSNYTPKLNTFYAIYFTLTGLHGLHVVAGALVLFYFGFLNNGLLRSNPEHLANRVEVGGLFWHFVDLVWIFLFPLLYLL